MKRGGLIVGTLAVIALVAAASVGLANGYLTRRSSAQTAATVQCSAILNKLQVIIKNNQVMPTDTQAQLCDSLTITNLDYRLREIAFGPHDNHVAYDGVLERLLNQGQSLTVTLNQAGSFTFHDHIDDRVVGFFDVSPL